MNSFSAKNRAGNSERLRNTYFDLVIVGGGITGAGIALDATSRGLSVALIEMQDFAAGTSGRSTKLIHGGLRYLKQGEFRLVAEVGKEREIIHSIAPHLTRPEKMLLPIVKGGSLGRFSARLGMTLYEWLAGVKKSERHQVLSQADALRAEPLLNKETLLGGILFYEYRTDDARLTIEVMKEAAERGACCLNYMKASGFLYTTDSSGKKEKIAGVQAIDQSTGESFEIKGRCVVNAGGPWVDELDNLDRKNKLQRLHITKGVHLVMDEKKLPVKQAVYFDTPDKRMIFVIPRNQKIYIGTTDTSYKGDLINPQLNTADKKYLVDCVNRFFQTSKLSEADIESSWVGLRPLIHKAGKGPSEISRKDELFISDTGLITIAGGKLTGYRKMAERVVNRVSEKIKSVENKPISECVTGDIKLSGGKINDNQPFSEYIKIKVVEAVAMGIPADAAERAIRQYGSNATELFKYMVQLNQQEQHELPLALRAQLMYGIEQEMCLTPSDFFIRRTGQLYFDIETVRKWKTPLVMYMQHILGFSDDTRERYMHDLECTLKSCSGKGA
ncbi:MAG: glycerol-3-phosphate dehydrogenase/oxidase [Bacteroidetes bacterium]|nr:glycerol-3-phosphate dehydrogenase/oxidase [Bacteroidota bacterium]